MGSKTVHTVAFDSRRRKGAGRMMVSSCTTLATNGFLARISTITLPPTPKTLNDSLTPRQ